MGKQLKLVVMPTTLKVRPIPTCFVVVQNLVSNAIKYTLTGKVLIGAPARHNVIIQVADSASVSVSKFRVIRICKARRGSKTASALGSGLSIVDRIARVLDHPVELRSIPDGARISASSCPST